MPDGSQPIGPNDHSTTSTPELVVVTMSFTTSSPDELVAVLARYVVLSRGRPGCINIDLMASSLDPRRLTIIEKWASAQTQRDHFDSADMVAMARAAVPLLEFEPTIELHYAISAHDLI